tara:strand:- start:29 stop:541 length:513 start_codon:yes stop_codon:yes gene_type:complete
MQKDKSLNAAIKRVKTAQGMEDGGVASLKEVPAGNKGKGLSKLPTEVRNKMGFMASGGMVKKPKGRARKKTGFNQTGKTLSDADVAKVEKLMKPKTDRQLMQFEKGGEVTPPKPLPKDSKNAKGRRLKRSPGNKNEAGGNPMKPIRMEGGGGVCRGGKSAMRGTQFRGVR